MHTLIEQQNAENITFKRNSEVRYQFTNFKTFQRILSAIKIDSVQDVDIIYDS